MLTEEEWARFDADAESLVRKYFELEDPRTIRPIGLELKLEADLGRTRLRGIIDRLELDENGEFVVTDYKTGSVPSELWEAKSLSGVHMYALLCERMLGRRPARVQLYYLSKPEAIIATPTDQSIRGVERRTTALYDAIANACSREDFKAEARPPLRLLHLQAVLPRPRRESGRRARAARPGHGDRAVAAVAARPRRLRPAPPQRTAGL